MELDTLRKFQQALVSGLKQGLSEWGSSLMGQPPIDRPVRHGARRDAQ
jgi:hypothetical protein